ncbi:MAG: hypothetical protein JO154_26480 [Chitinophaga sp.]|uniref:hypothetical protein n=1 Tax=Chitinophaga sp. TaxID=1869181 RepID=UPI0025C30788|nr:hypothetical protein [Chitinophaga sp.]MBV8256169.1 hypothetical protein [Chitinophaga sp.]
MKRTLYLLLMLLSFRSFGQVTMTPQLPPAGILMKAQLWNMILVSGSQSPVSVQVAVRLMDATTNQPLLTGITKEIVLTRGAKQLQAGDFMPIQYEYLSNSIDRSANATLPAGSYLVCYSLILSDNKHQQIGDDCVPFVVEPVSPPVLNMPADGSLLDTRAPQFTWIPPAPLNMFTDLNYDMVITNVRDGQSPQEAIQQNIPVYRGRYLKNIFVNYPTSGTPLDTGVNYAWTITARNGALFAAQAEVWTFKIKGIDKKVIDNNSAFVQLRRELDAAVVTVKGSVNVVYVNEAGDNSTRYEIISSENNTQVYNNTISLERGENRINLPLQRVGLRSGASYLLRLRNSRNETWQLRFIYSE